MSDVLKKIAEIGIVPVVKLDSPDQAVALGKALAAGGLPIAEVTFRTDAAEESIKKLNAELPGLLVGAGTVTTVEQVKRAAAAGAKFIVSPGFNPSVVKYCVDSGLPVTPGVNSPSQIEQGIELGLSVLKFFPAEQSGGLEMLKAFAGPYGSVKYVPTGGISAKNMAEYLAYDKVLAVGGSWMVKPELVSAGKYDEVTRLCREAVMTSLGFALHHLGVNEPDESASLSDARKMSEFFGFALKPWNSSNLVGAGFEFMKKPFLGKNGHIAIGTLSVERAVTYFAGKGVATRPETEKRDASGSLAAVYLNVEIGGFALHLVRARTP
ncbi:MAG: bifunctional 4-hydroxy-2-oxoglutarate aldolase/2-dehydro-3-deoxy-phosphogluconate aldolase [Synergistaceae bacterium]|jgi:2-dehydro-3-deoxyphosphogluconate aldolase/(4S)-4-hydroxy-2-oxoglutarate aldolase|nr:bifunctional 4-hydroxy-2-oxoglutarate aldolase/2-dehydro-3-deoxy-phosphogluconate aldolase [Synergistaceae bacterium]